MIAGSLIAGLGFAAFAGWRSLLKTNDRGSSDYA